MSVGETVLNLLFPPKCPFCGRVTDRAGACDSCRRMLPWTAEEDQVQTLPGKLPCAAPLWYEGAVRQGLLRFKFSGASGGAEALGELIARCAAERFSGGFDAVTWVPVSAKRLRRRGFDQAELLARSACRLWNTRPEPLLRKTADNPAQSGLAGGAAERRANVLGVYEPTDPVQIENRRILLVDDIVTTGATLCECARTLREAGAAAVLCVTVARTRL